MGRFPDEIPGPEASKKERRDKQGHAKCTPHSPPRVRGSCGGLGPTWRQTRDFSSRYCSILAPSMAPRLLKWMSMYFPKRLELSLRMVLAFPNAASVGEGHGSWSRSTPPHPTATPLLPECPSPTFQDGSGFQHLLLNPRVLPTDGRQELQDQLRALCLPCPRLPTAEETQAESGPVTAAAPLQSAPHL